MKTVTFYRPATARSVLSDFDRYIGSFFGDSPFTPATGASGRLPQADVRETEKAYLLDLDLPGRDENDIEISIDGGRLSVSSKQEAARADGDADSAGETEPDTGTWLLRERRNAPFSRSFSLPENANPEEVSAGFRNGVLSLEIAKRPEAQKRTVPINAK